MKHILGLLNQLEATSSTNTKKEMIKDMVQDPLFVRVAKMALDAGVSYGFTDVLEEHVGFHRYRAEEVLDELQKFSEKRGVSNEDIVEFSKKIPDTYTAEVVRRIIRRDLRCGAGPALFGDIIKQVPYQRYKSFKSLKDIDFNDHVVAQLKMDGLFSFLDTRDWTFTSRQGNTYNLGPLFNGRLAQSWIQKMSDTIFMGEVLVLGPDGKYLPRKESNGIINSFISGEGDPNQIDNIRYVTWGFITVEDFNRGWSDMTYEVVLATMATHRTPGGPVIMSDTERVRSLEEANRFYKVCRKRKEEGAIIKNASKLKWKNEQSGSKYGVKLKAFAEAEFRIVDAYYGKEGKKNEFILGGLVVESEDKKIRTKVGMGFSEEERERGVEWWKEQIGGIITVQYCGVTKDKTDRATFCLEHSSFVEARFNEKSVADTYERILEELDNA